MKKIGIYFILFFIVLLAGCGHSKGNQTIHEVKIGVSVYNQDDTFISSIVNYLEMYAKEEEKTSGCKIILNIVDGKGSQTIQNDQVDKFIKQGYNAICMNLVDRTAAATMIDKAKAADISIVFFNREPVGADMNRWSKVYYVGSKPEEAGEMQGEIVLEQYKKDKFSVDRNKDGKIQYVMLEGEQGHQDALIRTEYCLKPFVFNDIPLEKLANSTANWRRSQGEEKMTTWLKHFGGTIEVVFSNNDEMALGAISAIKKSEYKDILVVGVDGVELALEAIENGEMLGTVLNDGKKQAKSIFDIAYIAGIKGDISQIEELKGSRYVKCEHIKIVKE